MEGEPADMEWEPHGLDDPAVAKALAELRAIIAASHPDATFEVYEGDDPSGM